MTEKEINFLYSAKAQKHVNSTIICQLGSIVADTNMLNLYSCTTHEKKN